VAYASDRWAVGIQEMQELRQQNHTFLILPPSAADATIRLGAFHNEGASIFRYIDLRHWSAMNGAPPASQAMQVLTCMLPWHCSS
jgi:hypothetical protein